jgi:hypothetical protein
VRVTFGAGVPVLRHASVASPTGPCPACRLWSGTADSWLNRAWELVPGWNPQHLGPDPRQGQLWGSDE